MKQIRPCTDFNLFVICVLVGLSAAISGYGQDVPNGKPSKPATTVPASYEIHGTVIDMTPDISEASFAKFEYAVSNKEDKEVLSALEGIVIGDGARSNAVVRLRGDSVKGVVNLQRASWWDSYDEILKRMLKEWAKPDTASTSPGGSVIRKEVVTDSRGNFEFVDLPAGVYQISAEAPARLSGTGIQRMATGRIIVVPAGSHSRQLEIHAYAISVKGRIAATDGKPIAGARVTGVPVPFYKPYDPSGRYEYAYQHRISTVSKSDGSYELQGLPPPNIYRIAGYLCGGDPTEGGRNSAHFYVEIHVEADGYVQGKENVPRVPLVTEELLDPARRLLKALSRMAMKNGEPELQEKKSLVLPSSHGNTITGIDIVLKKAGDGGQ